MTTTITGTGGVHTPTLFLLYNTVREGGASIDDLLDHDIDVQLGVAGSREGRFAALYDDIDDAVALEAELSAAQVLELASTERPALDMDFVVPKSGRINVDIDPQTRRNWTVTWDFREVS